MNRTERRIAFINSDCGQIPTAIQCVSGYIRDAARQVEVRLVGFLNFSQSSFCVALESLQKSAVQTFTRKGNRLLCTATLEHGDGMSINALPNLPGISGNLGGIGNGKFDYGFIGLREDGLGGLYVSRYKY